MATRQRTKNKESLRRQRLFRAATIYYETPYWKWAGERGIRESYFAQVLRGFQSSPRIDALIDQTIDTFVADIAQLAAKRQIGRGA